MISLDILEMAPIIRNPAMNPDKIFKKSTKNIHGSLIHNCKTKDHILKDITGNYLRGF